MNAPLPTSLEETPAVEPDRQFATTLASGIDILLAFRVGDTALGNKEFAERTGLSRPAVARLTHTLVQLGYLRHDDSLGKYRLGAAVLSASYSLLAGMHVRQIARPLMKALADRVGAAVSLGTRDRVNMVYVETARSTGQIAFTPDIGATLPILTTAMGRAWLCRASAKERDETLNRIKLADPETWRRQASSVQLIRDVFEQRGYCACRAEWREDVYGFAAPLARPIEGSIFVLNCGVPVDGRKFAAIEGEVAPQLVALVRELEALLGMR